MDLQLSDKRNLRIKIVIIGYPSCGESIVACICDNETVLYSCVVDSFKYKGHNETITILNRFGIKHVNLLCWSHPDHDHSFDMDAIIDTFCDDRTAFLLPHGLNGKPYDNINYNKGDEKIVARIAAMNAKRKLCHNTICVVPKRRQEVDSFSLLCYPEEIPISIMALSPPSPLINHRIQMGQTIKKNEFCISLCIEMGGYRFLLCSDIENPVIESLHSESLQNPVLVKIPHHASPTADALLEYSALSPTSTYACATGFKSKQLPNSDILNTYAQRCRMVHFTGQEETHKYGAVEYTFFPYTYLPTGNNAIQFCSCMNIKCHGNAIQVQPA